MHKVLRRSPAFERNRGTVGRHHVEALRTRGEGSPGEMLASSTVTDLVVGSGLTFRDRGKSRSLSPACSVD